MIRPTVEVAGKSSGRSRSPCRSLNKPRERKHPKIIEHPIVSYVEGRRKSSERGREGNWGRKSGRKGTHDHREHRQSWMWSGALGCERACIARERRAVREGCMSVWVLPASMWRRLEMIRTELDREERSLGCCQRAAQDDVRRHFDVASEVNVLGDDVCGRSLTTLYPFVDVVVGRWSLWWSRPESRTSGVSGTANPPITCHQFFIRSRHQPASQTFALPFPHLFRSAIRMRNGEPRLQGCKGYSSHSVCRHDDAYSPMEGPLGCPPSGACEIRAEAFVIGLVSTVHRCYGAIAVRRWSY
jgi:hypothetical protein